MNSTAYRERPEHSAAGDSAPIELHAFAAESWFSVDGARIKARRLQQAGLPDLSNWRFITLTLAIRHISPFEAYQMGKQRMRRFLTKFRTAIGRSFSWCWKLEFHHDDDGYPHWHLLIDYRKRMPTEILRDLEAWWNLGRVNVRRVLRRDVPYVFKYVAKGPEDLPEWVIRHKGRLRVFQACQGFYTARKHRRHERKEPRSCLVNVDLHTRIERERRMALLISTNPHGQRRVRAVKLRMTFNALQVMRAHESIRQGVQLAAPGVVTISQWQSDMLQYEHRKFAGLAGIPRSAATA